MSWWVTPLPQMLFMASLPSCIVISIVAIASSSRSFTGKLGLGLGLLFLILLLPVSMQKVKSKVMDWRFASQRAQYQETIRTLTNNVLSYPTPLSGVGQRESLEQLGSPILAEWQNGVLTVEFITGRALPTKHSGYLFRSDGVVPDGSLYHRRWRTIRRLETNWFVISD